ncbi:MAG: hypothetical protein KF795_29790 [Labilithrix sp.]|nr:hypothetical protein [Labilithrix sp.]
MQERFQRRTKALWLLTPCVAALIAACSSDGGNSSSGAPDGREPASAVVTPPSTPDDDEQDDLSTLKWNPSFEPDFNHLAPQPWVEPVSAAEKDTVVVHPDELVFSALETPEVRDWAPGRVVVSAPGEGAGQNPLGFARRVVSVRDDGDRIVVATETVSLEDVVSGDFQSTYDPADAKDVDLDKLDLEWAAKNLYMFSPDVFMPGEPLLDDAPDPMEYVWVDGPQPFFGAIKKAVTGAAKAVASVAQNAISAITPPSFNGAVSISPEIGGQAAFPLFSNMNYKKTIKSGKTPLELYIKGSADMNAKVFVNPGFQVGATIPNILHKNRPPFSSWINIDSRAEAKFGVNFDLEAGIASAGGEAGSKLEERLGKDAEFAQEVLSKERQALFGDSDMKPAGGWRKPIFVSKPSTKVLMAGPVPVVLVSTVQVDVECGFEAKAAIKGSVEFEQAATFKFSARYESGGKPTLSGPAFDRRSRREVQVLGSGSIAVTCGLIPRINTMLYDSAGLTVGLRGSIVARASYESKCAETTTRPKGEVAVGLYGNVGIQLGARLQAPGSSYAGTAGQSAGFDIGPIEPWNTEFPLYEKTWEIARGLGYCTPTCQNGKRDERETDTDCGGGGCQTCTRDKKCKVNSDCAAPAACSGGVCKVAPCFDGVISSNESDVDCGGSCSAKCAVGKSCNSAADCGSGFCNKVAGRGVCVADRCSDGVRNGDESGVDCGGSCATKCKTGAQCAIESDCASGYSNGTHCVASACLDRKVSSGETDLDCGGLNNCARCGVGQACNTHTDCSRGPHALLCTDGTCQRPTAVGCDDGIWTGNETDVDCGGSCGATCDIAQMCKSGADCASGSCFANRCVECERADQCASGICRAHACAAPACDDGVKNGAEGDVDCGGTCSARCALAQSCHVGADCASTHCSGGSCVECTEGAHCRSGICEANACAPMPKFLIGGVVQGLADGEEVTIALNASEQSLTLAANDPFTFTAPIERDSTYAVTVTQSPANKVCVVREGSGTVATDVTNVKVICGARAYSLKDAPYWGSNPPAYSCLEACAHLFGGSASNYACSVEPDRITHTAWVSGYGTSQYCAKNKNPASETFKVGSTYGTPGTFSAYVRDHCYEDADQNYCFPR